VIGVPSDVGGANTELWHTLRLWRQFGLDVTCVNTTGIRDRWRERLASIGVPVLDVDVSDTKSFRAIADSILVGFCNQSFLRLAGEFRKLDCRLTWVGCMNFLLSREVRHYKQHGLFDAYVFQSDFQQAKLASQLAKFKNDSPVLYKQIRGAFYPDEFTFQPRNRQAGEPLTIGRISRADPEKFHRETWKLYSEIAPDRKARVLGWSDAIAKRVGKAPKWAEVYAPGTVHPVDFYRSLHVLAHLDGQTEENWPRIGLEAMASGVPIVAMQRGGWPEMVVDVETGYLADDEGEWLACARQLERSNAIRMTMAEAARAHVEELCRPEPIWSQWENLFEALQ